MCFGAHGAVKTTRRLRFAVPRYSHEKISGGHDKYSQLKLRLVGPSERGTYGVQATSAPVQEFETRSDPRGTPSARVPVTDTSVPVSAWWTRFGSSAMTPLQREASTIRAFRSLSTQTLLSELVQTEEIPNPLPWGLSCVAAHYLARSLHATQPAHMAEALVLFSLWQVCREAAVDCTRRKPRAAKMLG